MRAAVLALLFSGFLVSSFAQDGLEGSSGLVVFKGTTSYVSNYILDNSKEQLNVNVDMDRVTATKPKVYYFVLCDYDYTPDSVPDKNGNPKWTGEGYLDLWPMGAIQYGVGMHNPDMTWDKAAKYSYYMGSYGVDFEFDWLNWWPKNRNRVGFGWIDGYDTASKPEQAEYGNWSASEGLAVIAYKAKKYTDKWKEDGQTMTYSYYAPYGGSILMTCVMGQDMYTDLEETEPTLTPTKFGVAKVKLTVDSKLTTLANDTLEMEGPDAAKQAVLARINEILVKGKYPEVPYAFGLGENTR